MIPLTVENVEAAQRERKCVCGIPSYALTADSQAIVASWHGNPQGVICPDCGRERIVCRWAFDPTASDR